MNEITVREIEKAVEGLLDKKGETKLPFNREQIKKILVINLGGMGDVLFSTPALRALTESFSQGKIWMLISPKAIELVKGFPGIGQVCVFGMEYGGAIPFDKMLGNLRLLLRLRRERFDLVINMRTIVSKISALKLRVMMDIIKPKIKVGRDTRQRGYFLDIKIPETDAGDKPEMEYDIDTVEALGIRVKNRSIDFEISQEVRKKVAALLVQRGIGESDTVIGVHPGGMPSRQWGIENFTAVIQRLLAEVPGLKVVVTGGKDEGFLTRELIDRLKPREIVDMTAQLSLKELGALIKRCNIFITNDTGPMHIAAIAQAPLIVLFGGGCLKRFDPRNISKKAIVFHKDVDCSPCDKVHCDSMKCIKEITPEEVIAAARSFLGGNR